MEHWHDDTDESIKGYDKNQTSPNKKTRQWDCVDIKAIRDGVKVFTRVNYVTKIEMRGNMDAVEKTTAAYKKIGSGSEGSVVLRIF